MTDSEIKYQVARLMRLKGFPGHEAPQEDLCRAASAAPTLDALQAAIDTILDNAESETRCPLPNALRRAIYDAERSGESPRENQCSKCDGMGLLSVPMLVHYEGNSQTTHQRRLMREWDWPTASRFAKMLPEDQAILSVAVECECRKSGAPILRQVADCRRCQDFGYFGGAIRGQYAGQWKWCDCSTGIRVKAENPDLVPGANEAREKILKLGSKLSDIALAMGIPGKSATAGIAKIAVEYSSWQREFEKKRDLFLNLTRETLALNSGDGDEALASLRKRPDSANSDSVLAYREAAD